MYTGMYPAFKDTMKDVAGSMKDQFSWIPGAQDMTSYVGFLNIEMYQIFWVLVLGLIIGFIAASSISKEIESKTIDLLLSNPISRKQLVFEKFIGLIPMIVVVDFVVMFVIMGITIGVGENLNFGYLFLTHVVSIPYFLSYMLIIYFEEEDLLAEYGEEYEEYKKRVPWRIIPMLF